MNLFNSMEVPMDILDVITRSNNNRLKNGGFEDSNSSFFPWFASGEIKLETKGKSAYLGKQHITFIPGEGQVGKISQKTKTLYMGKLYVLRFVLRSTGKPPRNILIQFGERVILINGTSLPQEYKQITIFFRARSKRSRLGLSVVGNESGTKVDMDSISLLTYQTM